MQPTPTPAPNTIPAELYGKILFWSDRNGADRLYALDPATQRIALVTENWPFALAEAQGDFSPLEPWVSLQVRNDLQRIPQIYVFDSQYNVDRAQITAWQAQAMILSGRRTVTSSPSSRWKPATTRSTSLGPTAASLGGLRRTPGNGTNIQPGRRMDPRSCFGRTGDSGRRQLWIMDADGSNPSLLINSPYNDWNPVWVK
ncbi:MAG: hypothetical protein R2856_28630 [Caldilineaceae bacterium]